MLCRGRCGLEVTDGQLELEGNPEAESEASQPTQRSWPLCAKAGLIFLLLPIITLLFQLGLRGGGE